MAIPSPFQRNKDLYHIFYPLYGWRYNGSALVIGEFDTYQNDIESRVSIVVHAEPIVSIKIVADYDTELD